MTNDTARDRVRRIAALLKDMYGGPPVRREDPLDALVATILSQNTSDVNSERAFRSLRARFPSWEDVRRADVDDVAEAIRTGGLAAMKAVRIQRILDRIHRETGELSLGFLAGVGLEAAREYLLSLEGVGPKTCACTLLFGFGLPAFPVDTHVLRIAKRLGLVPVACGADHAHEVLASHVPPDLAYALHVNMIAHGRRRCRPQRPKCDGCLLESECRFGKENAMQ